MFYVVTHNTTKTPMATTANPAPTFSKKNLVKLPNLYKTFHANGKKFTIKSHYYALC